jgi:molecular chaperone GrpE
MNPQDQIPNNEDAMQLDLEPAETVDDFIKELEAKEKDLHITADLTIEVEPSDFDPNQVPDFVQADLPPRPLVGANGSSAPMAVGLKTRVYELEHEVAALHDRLREIKAERNDIQEKSDRRLKDFENFKYRIDRERRGSFIEQISTLASQMLPVLDNLDRALRSAEAIQSQRSIEFQQFYEGIVLVNQQVNEVLGSMGVQPIQTVGETFDPHFHEAVATECREDLPPHTISEEMLRGYRIGNRVIRHSMVKVTTSPVKARPASTGRPDPSTLPDLDPPDLDPDIAESEAE